MKVNVVSNINIDPALRMLGGDVLGIRAAESLNGHMQEYIPKREGQLSRIDVDIKPWEVDYFAPYATYVYNMSANANFRKSEGHYKAGPEWDKRFVQEKTEYEKFIQDIQGWVDRNI